MKTGIELIAEERQRQILAEGWTPEHDATHDRGELGLAAICYIAVAACGGTFLFIWRGLWPWDSAAWKAKGGHVRCLTKAGALIAAEIDRRNNMKRLEEFTKS